MEIQDYYTEITSQELPSRGLFSDIKIYARGATAFELDKFESGDFSSYYSCHQEIFMLLSSCLLVEKTNGMRGSINLICDVDKFYILLKIKELTEDQHPTLVMSNTNHLISIELKCANLEYWTPSEQLMSFYDPELKCFKTESPFEYYFVPPVIGTNSCYLEWVKSKVLAKKELDKEFLNIGPYLSKSSYYISVDDINEINEQYNELPNTEFLLVKWFSDQICSSFVIRRLRLDIDDITYYANIDLFRTTTRIFNKI
jgi:hypothetical protein